MMRKIDISNVQNASEMVTITNDGQMHTDMASEGLYQGNYPNTAQEGLYWDTNK